MTRVHNVLSPPEVDRPTHPRIREEDHPMVSMPRIARTVLRAGGGRHIVRARNALVTGTVSPGSGGSGGGKEALSIRGTNVLTWYACGPTVYDDAHLGHARTYVCFDIIRRILMHCARVPVDLTLGITDVDDKILARAMESDVTPRQLARKYESRFHADMRDLNVMPPTRIARVTDHIPQIVSAVAQLQHSESAYTARDGTLYFSVPSAGEDYGILNRSAHSKKKIASKKLPKYKSAPPTIPTTPVSPQDDLSDSPPSSGPTSPTLGALTPLEEPLGELNLGDSSDAYKKDIRDFALWKPSSAPDNSHDTYNPDVDIDDAGPDAEYCCWDSPWGIGRPGWHVECTAMARSILGPHIDVHSGGIDLKFPHHTNELALADSLRNTCGCGPDAFADNDNNSGKERWVHTWLHSGHLHIQGRKMSKSLKNFISVREFLSSDNGIGTADNFRMFCLLHRYRASVEFSWDRMRDAEAILGRFRRFVADAHKRSTHALETKDTYVDLATVCTKTNAILQNVYTTKDLVEEALVDDFDTPKAISHISKLITNTNKLIDDKATAAGAAGVACLEAARVVADTMHLVGITGFQQQLSSQHQPQQQGMHVQRSGSDNISSVPMSPVSKEDDIVDELVMLRDIIREAATNRDWGRVYSACDSTRTSLRDNFGIEVRDGGFPIGRRWERIGPGSPSPFVTSPTPSHGHDT